MERNENRNNIDCDMNNDSDINVEMELKLKDNHGNDTDTFLLKSKKIENVIISTDDNRNLDFENSNMKDRNTKGKIGTKKKNVSQYKRL